VSNLYIHRTRHGGHKLQQGTSSRRYSLALALATPVHVTLLSRAAASLEEMPKSYFAGFEIQSLAFKPVFPDK